MSNEERAKQNAERAERQKQIAEKMKAKQLVVPAPAPQTPMQEQDAKECRAYLEDNGWTLCGLDDKGGPMFSDPLGTGDHRGKMIEARELPNRDGEPTIVKQMVVPPTSWVYRLGDAFAVQQARDRAKQVA